MTRKKIVVFFMLVAFAVHPQMTPMSTDFSDVKKKKPRPKGQGLG